MSDTIGTTRVPLRLLIAPMAVAAETGGPFIRARTVAVGARDRGHVVAFCAGEDPNYRPVDGIPNYLAPVPSPFGTPIPVGRVLFRAALFLFRYHELPVTSFEQALHIIGATSKEFFARDVDSLRRAIRTFRPDVVFWRAPGGDRRSQAGGHQGRHNVRPADGPDVRVQPRVQRRRERLPARQWAPRRGVRPRPVRLGRYEGRPQLARAGTAVGREGRLRGPLQGIQSPAVPLPFARRRNVVAYMGSGGFSPRRLIRALDEAFRGTGYEIYVSTKEARPLTRGTIHVDRWFDFDRLLPEAAISIHHGGQNSVVSALVHGVPQIICTGRHYERRFNARSVEQLGAGVRLEARDITPRRLRDLMTELRDDPSYARAARDAGERLLGLGGLPGVLEILQGQVAPSKRR